MPVIEFDTYERECDHNTVLRELPRMHGIPIKDYRVRIDGEVRAWIISRRPHQRGYDVVDVNRRSVDNYAFVESKQDFHERIVRLLELGKIPTRDPVRAARERQEGERREQDKNRQYVVDQLRWAAEGAVESRAVEMLRFLRVFAWENLPPDEIKKLSAQLVAEIEQEVERELAYKRKQIDKVASGITINFDVEQLLHEGCDDDEH